MKPDANRPIVSDLFKLKCRVIGICFKDLVRSVGVELHVARNNVIPLPEVWSRVMLHMRWHLQRRAPASFEVRDSLFR